MNRSHSPFHDLPRHGSLAGNLLTGALMLALWLSLWSIFAMSLAQPPGPFDIRPARPAVSAERS